MDEEAAQRPATRAERRQRFARELGSIVLGVLIALGIGEIADAIRWHMRVGHAVAAMKQESAGNRFNVVERRLYAPCIDRRLREIDAVLREAWRSGKLPPIDTVDQPGSRIVETAAYDLAIADGTPMHMGQDEARDIAIVYALATRYWPEQASAERELWATLSMLEQDGGPVDGNVLATLTEARARAQRASDDVTRLSRLADEELAKHDVPVEWGKYRNLAGLSRYVHSRPLCRPLLAH